MSLYQNSSKILPSRVRRSMQCNLRNPEQLLNLTNQIVSASGSEVEVTEEELSEDEGCVESEDEVDYDYTDENGNLIGLIEPDSSEEDSTEPSPHMTLGSMSNRAYGLRRSRTRRSPVRAIAGRSPPSPCSRTRDIHQSSPAAHQDSLSDRLEHTILALDGLVALLRNIKLEIGQATKGSKN